MAELAHCRWCNALVRWAVTAAARKAIPLDPSPDPRGNCYFDDKGLVHVVGAQRGLFGEDAPGVRYVPHWATSAGVRRRESQRVAASAPAAERVQGGGASGDLRDLAPNLWARFERREKA